MYASKLVEQLLGEKGRQVHAVQPDSTVFEALEAMAKHNIGALAVTQHGRLVGMFSERDYARKVILKGRASRDTPVRDNMTASVITVTPKHTMAQCMQLITDHRIRHLPVVENDELLGMVSVGDVVKTVMAEQLFMIEQLEGYIRGDLDVSPAG
jgi:CBS domain-containing protein